MKESLRKNFALILAFALPIILIVGVAISVYLPSLFISTNYNFIYASCTDNLNSYPYNCNTYLANKYSVVDGKLIVAPEATTTVIYNQNNVERSISTKDSPDYRKYNTRIFLHDTQKNESREITVEEAKLLNLNNLITSPDGASVSSNYNNGSDFFIFGGGRSSFGYFLTKGSGKLKLNLINYDDRYYYQNNFQFIGWVLPGRTGN